MGASSDRQIWEVQSIDVDSHLEMGWHSVIINATSKSAMLYIELQLDVDEDEREDGYCVVDSPSYPALGQLTEDSLRRVALHRTIYGGVEECGIVEGLLYFVMSDRAKDVFGWPKRIELSLASQLGELDLLREGLNRILSSEGGGRRPLLRL